MYSLLTLYHELLYVRYVVPQFSNSFFPLFAFAILMTPFFCFPSITSCYVLFHFLSFHLNVSFVDASGQQQPSSVGAQPHSGASDPGPIRATAPMWRCSRIMHMQRELHPTLLSSLEGIVDQMVWFRENWHEEVRRPKVLVLGVSNFVAACVFS